uniref:Uncharacterized protein n=1 Tax=Cucumis melo TaxID=3656 RepID=A0A9I9D634_CUCME
MAGGFPERRRLQQDYDMLRCFEVRQRWLREQPNCDDWILTWFISCLDGGGGRRWLDD